MIGRTGRYPLPVTRTGRCQELGLSHHEARSLGAQYVRTLRKEHGSVKSGGIAKRIIAA